MQEDIEYSIVALGLSATQIASIVKHSTGITVDPRIGNFLETLDASQLEATWKRLSENPGWSKHGGA